MPFDLDQIVHRFSSSLYWLYEQAHPRLGDGTAPRWLKTYLAFCALESFRTVLQREPKYVYCRFSLGKRGPKDMEDLDKYISAFRLYNPDLSGRPTKLSEHLVDFSISQGSLLQGQGLVDLTDNVPYELLVAAESELVPALGHILEDCLKLVDAKAPLKVLLFPSNRQNFARIRRKEAIEKLFNQNASATLNEGIQWLFVAIPLFFDWRRKDGDIPSLSHDVYTLQCDTAAAQGSRYSLQPIDGWSDTPEPIM